MSGFSVCALTTLRNDTLFLRRWAAYYGQELGAENLFIILDGHDQEPPENLGRVNIIRLPHHPAPRALGDRRRARVMSKIASGLLEYYDLAIATDVDEFIVLDPNQNSDLKTYLSKKRFSSLSALGLDVGQHPTLEHALDRDAPFLGQRRFAHVNSRYTKPSIISRPLRWGSGMHRIKGRNFRIDPNLYLFHFGMVDLATTQTITADQERNDSGWSGHSKRRMKIYDMIRESAPQDAGDALPIARRRQTWIRPVYAWNKPGRGPKNLIIEIPERFFGIV